MDVFTDLTRLKGCGCQGPALIGCCNFNSKIAPSLDLARFALIFLMKSQPCYASVIARGTYRIKPLYLLGMPMLMLVASAESVVSLSRKMMAKSGIWEIGSVEAHCLLFLNRSDK